VANSQKGNKKKGSPKPQLEHKPRAVQALEIVIKMDRMTLTLALVSRLGAAWVPPRKSLSQRDHDDGEGED